MRSFEPTRLSQLVNIGPKTEQWLNEIGIYTKSDLQEIGSIEAWRRIKRIHAERATDSLLYMLQGALLNLPWKSLPQEIKEKLIVQATAPTSPYNKMLQNIGAQNKK